MSDSSLRLPSAHAGEILQAINHDARWAHIGEELQTKELVLDVPVLSDLLDKAFFASLAKEEGRAARFSLLLAAPRSGSVHELAKLEPLSVEALRKLSAACDDDSVGLFVWPLDRKWFIWGLGVHERAPQRSATLRISQSLIVLTADDPGVLRLAWEEDIIFSFDQGRGTMPIADLWVREHIKSVLPAPSVTSLTLHHLSAMHKAMRAHGRGGALLVVRGDVSRDVKFRYQMVQYPVMEDDGIMRRVAPLQMAVKFEWHKSRELPGIQDPRDEISYPILLRHYIEYTDAQAALIGQLTAIDGVVVLDHAMCVQGFGGKISMPKGFSSIEVVCIDPKDQSRTITTIGDAFAGMRHKSAAVACREHGPGALGLVQSQDGALTVIMTTEAGELQAVTPLARFPEQWSEAGAPERS
jgi:hypothetical protein